MANSGDKRITMGDIFQDAEKKREITLRLAALENEMFFLTKQFERYLEWTMAIQESIKDLRRQIGGEKK